MLCKLGIVIELVEVVTLAGDDVCGDIVRIRVEFYDFLELTIVGVVTVSYVLDLFLEFFADQVTHGVEENLLCVQVVGNVVGERLTLNIFPNLHDIHHHRHWTLLHFHQFVFRHQVFKYNIRESTD